MILIQVLHLGNIPVYTIVCFFTSIGGTVDHSINNGGGPYIFRLNGHNHHVFGALIPNNCEDIKFCQLYIYDTIMRFPIE